MSGPVCGECGAPFDPNTWDVKQHRAGCSQARQSNRRSARVPNVKIDKKMIFLYHWQIVYPDLFRQDILQPVYDPEHKLDDGTFGRGWVLDFAWPPQKVLVEIDGGNHLVRYDSNGVPRAVGRHTQDGDYEKINAAIELGWLPLRYTTSMIKTKPVECCEQVHRVLTKRRAIDK